ncbi:DNA mismatch repair protein MutL [Dissulfuribacter thermophilus]|uniref:DNA mismatch repair protein MutL n=1 Tax=Dissulfuribacter thermophilus TaxID=1156395 RepID=A0A1B9F899_9BACT|nr:DNA mismatch repair endonuclease MutL [Dissulfuribacter thermophilus]OCC16142.1 DNA mismatch repair protein MutL [Dissulfuribacter thermophilus]
MSIRILPPHIANQIAAGEVVERPSSVVKELIENALDAGASEIVVEVEKGGKSLIRVMDNGNGMKKEDLELCVERHATSKIEDEEDLYAIKTLGFRGEALPSIGAVSELVIKSRSIESGEEMDSGWMVKVFFGRNKEVRPCPCPFGTIVEVRDLFLEIPARRRFLKSDQAELGHINKVVRTYAVAFPEKSFVLRSGRKELFSSPKRAGFQERFVPLLGQELASKLVPIEGEGYGIKISGAVSTPGAGITGPRQCHFFLNRRPFGSRFILKAVKEASRGLFMKNEYPALVLFLDMDSELVDVNCHPSKQEVRFRYSDRVFKLVYASIKNAFLRKRPEQEISTVEEDSYETPSESQSVKTVMSSYSQIPFFEETKELENSKVQEQQLEHVTYNESEELPTILGQVLDTYIVGMVRDGLFLMDQHGAHEALLFKRLLDQLKAKGRLPGQGLAFPIIIERSPEEMEIVHEVKKTLSPLGFDLDVFGATEVAVRRVPASLAVLENREEGVRSIVDKAFSTPSASSETFLHDLVAKVACGSAVKAGQALHGMELKNLVYECIEEGVTNCPHGRPVFVVLNRDDLERLFKRK